MANKPMLLISRLLPITTSLAIVKRTFKSISYNSREVLTSPCKTNLMHNVSFSNKKFPVNYVHLEKKKKDNPKLLQPSNLSLELLKALPKTFTFRRREDPNKRKKRVPKLILLQNPFRWLMTKIDFRVLRSVWDPSFTEKEFQYGTKQAISRVTQVISNGNYEDLNGLLTKPARLSLLRELERNWNGRHRVLLALKHEDIQISSPRKVYFIRIADKKFCDVDMSFLALKWVPINTVDALIFTEIFARFHREYTPHCIPEWTIAYFKVTRFEVLRR
ncbi:m-AAA protease-interacting protein 1, mitochondrial-like [Battus philenor]|uniref:m-AAA protease-interacting protein 1, mitochondrial-like n=1 Tax=Battus philenor TaxID=42288 RepID=UPI0035CED68D